MKTQSSSIYKDYPTQPYIDPKRDLEEWEKYPDRYYYGVIPKANMEVLSEDILAGDVIMLWRIGFNNFTNKSIIPQYFEFRYGVNSDESIQKLIDKDYVTIDSILDSLDLYNATELKRLLKTKGLKLSGNKNEVLKRVQDAYSEEELKEHLDSKRYAITAKGKDILKKYDSIIQKHGPKG